MTSYFNFFSSIFPPETAWFIGLMGIFLIAGIIVGIGEFIKEKINEK